MNGKHPSEATLQQYVLNRAACRKEEIDHVGNCPHCQSLITIYSIMISELKQQGAPAFDFDLQAAVIERVQTSSAQERPDSLPLPVRKGGMAAMWTVITLVIGASAWLFRKSAYFVFTDMSPAFYWVLLTATGFVVSLFVLRLQKKYQDVINLINK